MGTFLLAGFLIVFGLQQLFSLAVPLWVTGLLALLAGILLLVGDRVDWPARR